MRLTTRLLASVRFLEPKTPTGLCGLLTHPTPRPTLIYLYNSTLSKLQAISPSSLYRQSTEALTNHRLKIVESAIPAGYEEWKTRSDQLLKRWPQFFYPEHPNYVHGRYRMIKENGKSFVQVDNSPDPMVTNMDWDGEEKFIVPEGARSAAEKAFQKNIGGEMSDEELLRSIGTNIKWEPEPPLNADQISEIETQIGAGLIEEVIEVAKGELTLVDEMAKSKVWEELEEKPVEGQWTYFSRDTGTPTTQAPPK